MKNLYKFLGIVTIVAVIGLTVMGCPGGGGDNDNSGSNTSGNNTGGNNTGGNNSGGNNTGGSNIGGDNTGGSTSGGNTSGGNTSGGNTSGGGGTTPSAPSFPYGVTATAQSSSSISVSWDLVSGATSYKVYYEKGTSSTKNLAGTVTGTSYTHTGLEASTNYYYYIKAVNSAGESDYSLSAYARTQAASSSGGGSNSGGGGTTVTKPSAPTGVTASRSPRSNESVTISWNTVSGATSYKLYRSNTATGTYEYAGVASSPPVDKYYYNDTTSYWKISAVNDAGESALSSTYGTALGWQQ